MTDDMTPAAADGGQRPEEQLAQQLVEQARPQGDRGQDPRRTGHNRPVYTAIDVAVDGQSDILGLWIGSGGEGATSGRCTSGRPNRPPRNASVKSTSSQLSCSRLLLLVQGLVADVVQ
jgi:hypothetical protein